MKNFAFTVLIFMSLIFPTKITAVVLQAWPTNTATVAWHPTATHPMTSQAAWHPAAWHPFPGELAESAVAWHPTATHPMTSQARKYHPAEK